MFFSVKFTTADEEWNTPKGVQDGSGIGTLFEVHRSPYSGKKTHASN